MEKMRSQWTENNNLSSRINHYNYQEFLVYYFHHLEVPQNQHIQVLQIGSGDRFLSTLCQDYKMKLSILDVDFTKCQSNSESWGVSYLEQDILKFQHKDYFDVIIDHHCLHCLSDESKVELALQNIYCSLKQGGLFIAEMMIGHEKISLKEDFIYNDHKIFKKDPMIPLRWVPPAHLIEDKLKEIGFNFKLFRAYEDLNFIIDLSDRAEAFSSEPQVLRFICTK